MARDGIRLPGKPATENEEDYFGQSAGFNIFTIWDQGVTKWDGDQTFFDPSGPSSTKPALVFDYFSRLGLAEGGSIWDDGQSIWDAGASVWD